MMKALIGIALVVSVVFASTAVSQANLVDHESYLAWRQMEWSLYREAELAQVAWQEAYDEACSVWRESERALYKPPAAEDPYLAWQKAYDEACHMWLEAEWASYQLHAGEVLEVQ